MQLNAGRIRYDYGRCVVAGHLVPYLGNVFDLL